LERGLFSLIGLLLRWRDTLWVLAGHFFAKLLVSEHGTGFGLLPRVLVLIGLPALARSRWRDMSDARRGAGSTRGRLSGAKR
jgi:hypothetical protein